MPLLELDGVQRIRLHGLDEEDEDGGRYCLATLADQEYRELKFNEYVATVETALKDRVVEEARASVAFPEELRILFELGVDGLCGVGAQLGCDLWVAPDRWYGGDLASRVQGPDKEVGASGIPLPSVQGYVIEPEGAGLDEWVIAGGWQMGWGVHADSCYALFCRRGDETEFGWRYVMSDEYGLRVFDAIPQLLDWYKDYGQGDLEYHLAEVDRSDGMYL